MPVKTHRCSLSVAAGCVALVIAPVHAADWHWDPRIEGGGIYNDNWLLTRNGQTSVTGMQLDAELQIRALTPVTEFRLVPRVLLQVFPSDHDQDTDGEFLTADYIYRGQRWFGDLNALFSSQSVLTSELPSAAGPPPGLGNPVTTDTGFITARSRREDIYVAPSATFQLSQRSKLQANVVYDDVSYHPPDIGGYVDFKSFSALLGLGYDFSQRSTVYLNAVGLRYEPQNSAAENSNNYGLRLEWWYHTSEKLQAYLRAGVDQTQDVVTTGSNSTRERTTNNVFGGGLTGLYQVTAFYVDVSQAVVPSGTGGLITRRLLQLRLRRSFSPRYAGFVQVYGADDSGAQKGFEFLDRRYAVGTAGLEWRFLREFSVRGQYSYRWQKYGNEPGGAHSNEILITLVYDPHRPEGELAAGYYTPRVY